MLTELDRLSIMAAIIYSCRGNESIRPTMMDAADMAYRLLKEVRRLMQDAPNE